jgi:hypothetical protein
VTRIKSYYDWELSLKNRPPQRKKSKNNKKDNYIGISADDFKRFVKLWKKKNIAF